MTITAGMVKELRAITGAGIMDCKKALQEVDGHIDNAVEYLQKKQLASAAKRSTRVAAEGLVESYIHAGGRIGVLLEVNCETDFVARTDDFRGLARNIAMQVALIVPIAMEEGLRFAIREGGRTVGAGVVAKIIE